MKLRWDKLGNQIGVIFCLAGLILVWAGWNGAASYDEGPKQFPYLISGGIAGLCLVVIGVGLFVVQSQRADRAQLYENLLELRRILETLVGVPADSLTPAADPTLVVAGPTTYHRRDCHLIEGRDGLRAMTPEMASAAGLEACRTCDPVALVLE
jgi:hypothetical protein